MAHSQTTTEKVTLDGYNMRFNNWPDEMECNSVDTSVELEIRKCDEGLLYVEVPTDEVYTVALYSMNDDSSFVYLETIKSDKSGFVRFADLPPDKIYAAAGSNGYGGFIQLYEILNSKLKIYKRKLIPLYVYSARSN